MAHSHASSKPHPEHHTAWIVGGLIVAVALAVLPSPFAKTDLAQSTAEKAVVQAVDESSVTVTIDGQTQTLDWSSDEQAHFNLQKGDAVVAVQDGMSIQIADQWRLPQIMVFFGLFLAVVLWISRAQGLRSLLALVISFEVLFKWAIPWILFKEASPLWVTGIALVGLTPITFYLSHGFSWKTHIALIGTAGTLLAVILISNWALHFVKLTGAAPEELYFLSRPLSPEHIFQLLVAGIWITLLGVMDDVTVAQASTVHELVHISKEKNPILLFRHAMQVGRDHISSVLNTLFLVWAGSSLPMLMLWIDQNESLLTSLNYEFMAEEVLQTLISSLALVVAVPVVTALAALTVPHHKE